MQRARALAILFAALTLAQLVPVWSVHFLPTGDGPCHVYNAWLLRELATGHATPAIREFYAIDWRPHPNWISHAFLAVAMSIAPPLVAEKLLFSLVLLVFLGGAWTFARAHDPDNAVYAFLAFPLAFHWLLLSGFYNFCLSFGLYLITIAVWWRRRNEPSMKALLIVAVLLLLCYFSHPMSAALAVASIGVLWLATLRGRPLRHHGLHLVALLPVIALLQWFLTSHSGEEITGGAPVPRAELLEWLTSTHLIFTFDERQLVLGRVLFALVVILMVLTAVVERRRAEVDGFLFVALALVLVYFFAPSESPGRAWINQRMSLFLIFAPLPWLTPRLPRYAKRTLVTLLSIVALGNVALQLHHFRMASDATAEFLAPLRAAEHDRVLLPLLFQRTVPPASLGFRAHAVEYAAIEKRLIDLDNYQPRTGYFPIRYREGVKPPDIAGIEEHPGNVDPRGADLVFTWLMPANAPVATGLKRDFQLVATDGSARLYKKR